MSNEHPADSERIVASIVAAAGGQLAGRVRLQKIIYLLDQLGLDSGFSYSYHHYGPYSEELTIAAEFAKAFSLLEERVDHRASDGARYSVFVATKPARASCFGQLGMASASSTLEKLSVVSSTVLELAATAHWLRHYEGVADWRDEIKRRKGVKTQSGRLEKAETLLGELNLAV